jgi:hypothetical protein
LWYREGNDGTWSTFEIGLGTPAQTVRVLPATASYGITVPHRAVEETGDDDDRDSSEYRWSKEWSFDPRKSLSWRAQDRLRINSPRRENVRQHGMFLFSSLKNNILIDSRTRYNTIRIRLETGTAASTLNCDI